MKTFLIIVLIVSVIEMADLTVWYFKNEGVRL